MSTTSPQATVAPTRLERWEAGSNIPLVVLGLAFLVAYAAPIIDPDFSGPWRTVFEWVEIVAWVVFSIDFLLRLVIATDRWRFMRTHLLDLAAVVLPALRPLRALRVVTVLVLSTRRLSRMLGNNVMSYVAITAIAVWFVAGLAVTDAERAADGATIHTVWDGWWWSFITMATVGFGDMYPVTAEGRLVAVGLVLTGIALIGTITAYIAAWFASTNHETERVIKAELDENEDKLDALAIEVAELTQLLRDLGQRDLPAPRTLEK